MSGNVLGVDFTYDLRYDYHNYTSCSESGCDEEGICRCSTIEDARVTSVNIPSMVNHIYANYFDDSISTKRNSTINSILGGVSKEIDIYTIDRILRINKVYEPTNWDVQVCGGYYGEEIDDVILEDVVAKKIENQLEDAFNIIDLTERIEFLLMLEYDKILPELKGLSYKITEVERDSIIFGSDAHYKNVLNEDLEHYSDKNYCSIRGIVISKGDKYRLIDGYHRCSKSENRLIKVLMVNYYHDTDPTWENKHLMW
jgi:uncharacterized protein YqkB